MTQPCIFCRDECFDFREGAEEGCEGKRIGNEIICSGCLHELKEALGVNELKDELEYISE